MISWEQRHNMLLFMTWMDLNCWIPHTQHCFVASWFWRIIFFKFCQCIFALGNGWSPSIEQTNFKPLYSRIYKNTLCKLCLLKSWPNGSREEGENVKTLQIDGRTTSDQRNSLKFSAQVSLTPLTILIHWVFIPVIIIS